jgi:serine/threonine-protein kinase
MGEVYRAHDAELGREVALKVLAPTVSSNPDSLSRFEREARLLASLNHPNIAAIYGVARHDTTRALVLELVPGLTLADHIARGPIPVERALKLADQIAEALDAAHERGIVHRDLKPANVKVTGEGTVKVLDFGIAKVLTEDDGTTVDVNLTRAGVVVGTRAYMSPEQTRALPVDKRADIWAFGCVLYEMLTGRRAFGGSTATEITTAVLDQEPDWSALPEKTPAAVRRLLRRTLEKDPRRRLRDIADARIDLADAAGSGAFAAPTPTVARRGTWRLHAAWLAATLVVAALGLSARFLRPVAAEDARATHVSVPLPPSTTASGSLAISSDGRTLAIATTPGIAIRSLDEAGVRLLAGTAGATTLFMSPDGKTVGFWVAGRLRKVAVDGGDPMTIADVGDVQRGFSWADDDSIIYGHTNAVLTRIPAGGGAPVPITTFDPALDETSHRWPHIIRGRDVVLYAAGPSVTANEWNSAHIVAQSLTTGERRVIAARGSMPGFADGFVFYVSGRSLMAQQFDPARLEVSGPVHTLLSDVVRAGNGAASLAMSAAGSMAVVRGTPPAPRRLAWIDRQGKVEPLPFPPAFYGHPRLSPDGSQVAATVSDPDTDVWVFDLSRRTSTRLTRDGKSLWPVWTPDGQRIVYSSTRGGPAVIRSKPANGTGEDELLIENGYINRPGSWSGAAGLAMMQVRDNEQEVWIRPPSSAPQRFPASRIGAADPRLSPDGRWIAYRTDYSGRNEVFVDRFPEPAGGGVQVSSEGGTTPVWSADGRELIFRVGNEFWSAPRTTAGVFGDPRRLFTANLPANESYYDVGHDGRVLAVVDDQPARPATEFQLSFNIGAELRRRSAAR